MNLVNRGCTKETSKLILMVGVTESAIKEWQRIMVGHLRDLLKRFEDDEIEIVFQLSRFSP